MDRKFYEERPIIYMVIGLLALLLSRESLIAVFSGLLLFSAGFYTYFIRQRYRDKIMDYIRTTKK